ncbi:MAG: L-2-hydroxyglutarate oxidase [Acidimicrobiia bacterium]
MERADVVVVGAGILGLATARQVLARHPSASVVVVDKEPTVGAHQSGHNSGVAHAGVYYRPGSDKARLCVAGRASMLAYCQERGVDHRICGKVVVAVDDSERGPLAELHRRCGANGVAAELIGTQRLRELEPFAAGVEALHVTGTGIVDYAQVCGALAADVVAGGGTLRLGTSVLSGTEVPGALVLETGGGAIAAGRVVTCAGLHADRVARAVSGPDAAGDVHVVPFRGEYRALTPARSYLVNALVYPVPDPRFPFLGVHATRVVDGVVRLGPNAVPGLAREGYSWSRVELADLWEMVRFPGLRRLARAYWRQGCDEVARSLSPARFAAAVQRLIPEITVDDLRPAPAGVRAQAMRGDGSLVDDFAFHRAGRALHVLNAPSPAATAALEIGAAIAARLDLDHPIARL